mmetsp:Transcript_4801/g.9491  ORF Transcript_4801/g.9491 Transcript_4801/m.9491 type:complete len:172 (+) Transcript_4801:94-609(+)
MSAAQNAHSSEPPLASSKARTRPEIQPETDSAAGAQHSAAAKATVPIRQSNTGTLSQRGQNTTPTNVNEATRQSNRPAERACPSLGELCITSLCDNDLRHCDSLQLVPDHLAADMMVRLLHKGRFSPALARKFQSSTCDEVAALARSMVENLNNHQIAAGPVTPKSFGCRY